MKIIDTIKHALASAGLDTGGGPMRGVTDTIEQALSAAGLRPQHTDVVRAHVLDPVTADKPPSEAPAQGPHRPRATTSPDAAGEFISRSYSNGAGTRTYKLYVPAGHGVEGGGRAPMVVMLHGCTQSADDFAAGTRMNALADRHGFLVVYPEQAANANGSKCWNWFRPADQARDGGEPSLIAGITREVASRYHVDERRILVAGLSAGAAMAVILGDAYPELYAAIGAHSGLPHGAAHDMASAFGAMKRGPSAGRGNRPRATGTVPGRAAGRAVPTIVFHGDRDHTVHASNGAAIVAQARAGRADDARLQARVREDVAAGGRSHRHTVYADADNRPVVEQWELHGAGHAWSGGSANGSFTDAQGPDASAEMIRFFYAQPGAGVGATRPG